jgi:hypothetical protein
LTKSAVAPAVERPLPERARKIVASSLVPNLPRGRFESKERGVAGSSMRQDICCGDDIGRRYLAQELDHGFHSHRRSRGGMSTCATASRPSAGPRTDVPERIARLDWRRIAASLDATGCAVLRAVLSPRECAALAAIYDSDGRFRSRIVMARHGFGRGEYKYFSHPLPDVVTGLRTALYPSLATIANRWNETLGLGTRYPDDHASFLDRCHRAGQTKPTPLLLQYGEGDYNCLHQDLYGEHVFPLQAAFLLSRPGDDFTGGEFVLTEQRPRMQSRVEVVSLAQGDGVIFPVHHRPVEGTRGFYRVNLRHGVSRLRSGHRHTLGIIFHDAK